MTTAAQDRDRNDNPYRPPTARISEVPSSTPEWVLASKATRFFTYLVDQIAGFVWGMMLSATIVFFSAALGYGSVPFFLQGMWTFVSGTVFAVLYYVFFEGIWARTPGKWLLGTRVILQDGTKPGFLRIAGRSFARVVPFEQFTFLFEGVGFHDRASRTLVITTRGGAR